MRRVTQAGLVLLALLLGLCLAGMVFFATPTLYGLRPHAVDDDLPRRSIAELLALAEHGPVTGILTYDAWYKGRDGRTGWFLLPVSDAAEGHFAVKGPLEPALSKAFGVGPRRCGGTGLPAKMVRAVEPDRQRAGFLGRSTCGRHRLDVSDLIARSVPARRTEMTMTHAALRGFDATPDPLLLRDAVDFWPTPYAYHRTLVLPVVWERVDEAHPTPLTLLIQRARDTAADLHQKGVVGVQMHVTRFTPTLVEGLNGEYMPYQSAEGLVLLTGVTAAQIAFEVQCAPDQRAACNAVDVSGLMAGVDPLRDAALWAGALQTAAAPPENTIWRDVLNAPRQQRDVLSAPLAKPRMFDVTLFDARAP
ncbi:hypothetical protein ABMC88_09965 [Sulfitobacter sp. HNIBRBA2951]|uniref:hypothetical protein n=1 Tax=Sulfitobacter aquimarinus TaxID=3158557 RepID=UPI0032DFA2B8